MNTLRLVLVLHFGLFGVRVTELIQSLASEVREEVGSYPGLWTILGMR